MFESTYGIDFEFYNSQEKDVKNVCAVICNPNNTTDKFWILNPTEKHLLWKKLNEIKNSKGILLAYAAMAEARSLMSECLDPLHFRWIDLYVEFRMLCNSNNMYNHGKFIDKDGKIKISTPPVTEEGEDDNELHISTPKNMVNALYKLLNIQVDVDEKIEMRDLILSKNLEQINLRKEEILEYCKSDTQYLRALDIAICKAYQDLGMSNFREDQLSRGRYAAAVAKTENLGMPIDLSLLDKIIEQTPNILQKYRAPVNEHFPFFLEKEEGKTVTLKNGKLKKFKDKKAKKDMKAYQRFVKSLNIPDFPTSETGVYKSDKQTLVDFRKHHPALRNLLLYNEAEANLKWFNKGNKDGFFERVGSDDCIRPYFGIFGTQTGRNAAKAKTFPLAMSSWLRAIIRPFKDCYILGADFSQQEVYVAAILSKDSALLEAYNSGDVYLAFAKQAGLVPSEATKVSHKHERNLCKSTVLGLQFGMGKEKLKLKLSHDTGTEVSDEKTQELIDAHKNTYVDYWSWVYELTKDYKNGNPLCTNAGWILWQDNPRIPSVRNFCVQGTAADITRYSVVSAWEQNLPIICSLHDADYVITKNVDRDLPLLVKIMTESTAKILGQPIEECTIRIDTKVISHDKYWVDEKGEKDWEEIRQFLGV